MTDSAKVQRPGKGQIVATVTVAAKDSTVAEEKALARLGQRVAIKGFRPGHVPAEMVRERINPGQLLEETVRELMSTLIPDLLKSEDIKPIVPPNIEVESRDPLVLKITFIERPEVTVKGADRIKIEKKEKPVTDADVERVVTGLLQRFRETSRSEAPSKLGDELVLTAKATDAKGVTVPELAMEHQRLLLGSTRLVPGFDEALIGLKATEQKTFTLTVPKDAPVERLRGQKVSVDATIESVMNVTLPELTESFVKERFGIGSAAEMRTEIRASLTEENAKLERQRREQALFDTLRDAVRVDLAPPLVQAEERVLLNDIVEQLSAQKRTLAEWLKESGQEEEAFKKELTTRASERLKLRFALETVLDEKKVEMTDEELTKEVGGIIESVPEERREELADYYSPTGEGWAQLKWQRRVEKLIASYLG